MLALNRQGACPHGTYILVQGLRETNNQQVSQNKQTSFWFVAGTRKKIKVSHITVG